MPQPNLFNEQDSRCYAVATVSLSGNKFLNLFKGINADLREWAQAWPTLIGQATKLAPVFGAKLKPARNIVISPVKNQKGKQV